MSVRTYLGSNPGSSVAKSRILPTDLQRNQFRPCELASPSLLTYLLTYCLRQNGAFAMALVRSERCLV